MAHEIDTVVGGLIWHHKVGSGQFGLWLNAVGSGVATVVNRLVGAGIPVAVTEPVALEELPGVLAAADCHLITLKARFSGVVLPSKVYGCLASNWPILFVGPTSSDVDLLCRRRQLTAYEQVEPGHVVGFSQALERLAEVTSVGERKKVATGLDLRRLVKHDFYPVIDLCFSVS